MIQVIEFRDAYPHYNMGFMADNELTATEKLIGMKSCLTTDVDKNRFGRVYQHWFLDEMLMECLFTFFSVEKKVKKFYLEHKTSGKVHFIGTRREDTICGICLETHERIMFSNGFTVQIGK